MAPGVNLLPQLDQADNEEAGAVISAQRRGGGSGGQMLLRCGSVEDGSRLMLLDRTVARMAALRDQNRRMTALLRRLDRESSLLARMDALHRENSSLAAKYTAMQVCSTGSLWGDVHGHMYILHFFVYWFSGGDI